MNKIIFILVLIVGVGVVSACGLVGGESAAETVTAQIQPEHLLTLDFMGSRIRVEAWDENYVKIDPTIKVKNPVEIRVEGNVIAFDYEKHMVTYPSDLDRVIEKFPASREVYFVIYVPRHTPLQILSTGLNAREGCLIQSVQSRMALVRDGRLADGFIGEGETFYMRDTRVGENCSLRYAKVMRWVGNGTGHWDEI
jgi:hypothetical protein